MSVPPALALLRLVVMLRTREDKMVVVNCLNRASGSLAGERQSKREKVCLTGTGSGSSEIAPL